MTIEAPRPQFRQLADLLRAGIERGDFAPGSALPSEDSLALRYGVNRTTVNRAVRLLRNDGLVRVERGRGTIVRDVPVIVRDAMSRYRRDNRESEGGRGAFDTEIRRLGMTPRSDTRVERVPAPARVAETLGIGTGSPVVARVRRMYANSTPVQLATSYIPADIADGTQLAEVDSGPGGIISRFTELGHAQVRISETIRVRQPDDAERRFLSLDEDQAVTEIWHVGWTADDRAVEVCIHVVPASLWTLDYSWPVS